MRKLIFCICLCVASMGVYANVQPKTNNLPNFVKIRETGVYHSSCGNWSYVMNYGGGSAAGFNRMVRMGEMAAAIEQGCATGKKTVHFYDVPAPVPVKLKFEELNNDDSKSNELMEFEPIEQI